MVMCLNHCSISVKDHHDQGHFYRKKAVNDGLAYSFRDLVRHHHGGEKGSMRGTGAVAEKTS